jgi:hypothetical protein
MTANVGNDDSGIPAFWISSLLDIFGCFFQERAGEERLVIEQVLQKSNIAITRRVEFGVPNCSPGCLNLFVRLAALGFRLLDE